MADVMTKEQRRRVMSRNRSKNTSPERYLAELLEAAGLVFVRHAAGLPGRPDFVFEGNRLALFVDGDFWHGWRFPIWQHRLAPFWRDKISHTRDRDRRNFQSLRRAGWKVVRIWEHQIEEDACECAVRVAMLADDDVDRSLIDARYATLPPLKRRKRLPKP